MSPLHFISLSGRFLRAVLYVAAALAVVFFALTRTEVGREGLREEIERQYARSFGGTLEIDELKGNLLNRLSASDVVLRDSAGTEMLRVDSVVVHPSWRDLLSRTISTGSITLIGPQVLLRRTEDGSWNVDALVGTRRPTGDDAPWSFRATRIHVINGRVVSENDGPLPSSVANGTFFNFADSEIRGIHGRAVVDWGQELKLVDILELDGHIPDLGLELAGVRGQVVLEDDRLSLNETYLEIGNSSMHLNGSVVALSAARAAPGQVGIELDLAESTIDANELARVIPALPLRDVLTASLRLGGRLSDLVIDHVELQRGESAFSAEGTATGLPDSLAYSLSVRPSSLNWRDVVAVWPDSRLPEFGHLGDVELSGRSEGIWHFGLDGRAAAFAAAVDVSMSGSAGNVTTEGTFGVGNDGLVHTDGFVEVSHLDLGLLLRRSDLTSRLNGRLELGGSTSGLYQTEGQANLRLRRSSFASVSIDTLSVLLDARGEDVHGSVAAITEAGQAYAQATGTLRENHFSYQIQGRTASLDIGRIIDEDSLETGLNSRFTLAAEGTSLSTLGGDVTVDFDTSSVVYRENRRHVLPHITTLSVRQHGSSQPHIKVGGDVFELEVTGNVALVPIIRLGREWATAFRSEIDREIAKRYRRVGDDSVTDSSAVSKPNTAAVSKALASEGLENQRLSVRGRILRSDIFSALLPGVPDFRTNLSIVATLEADEHRASFVAEASADSLNLHGARSEALSGRLRLDVPSLERLGASVSGDVTVSASQLALGGQTFTSPALTFDVRDRRIALAGEARAVGADEPFRVDAGLDLQSDRNRLVIRDLQLAARNQAWKNADSSVIDIYEDAAVVRGLRLERLGGISEAEHLTLQGTLSSATGDTLFVEAEQILLEHIASMLAIERPFGGSIDGRLAFTGLNRRPELTGQVRVAQLTYQNRLLGEVNLSSRYIPGSPDVGLDLELRPTATSVDDLLVHENRLDVQGTFRLPGAQIEPGRRDPGSVDLDLQVQRADAFFFEYIFSGDVSNVQGHLSGQGHIGGDFESPLFEARLALQDGRFDVPEFNLAYTASGPVRVDEDGIHLDKIRIGDADGSATVRGSVLFNEYRYFSFDLHGALSNLEIMRVSQSRDLPFYGTIRASGDMSLTGPLSAATLSSENAVTSAESDLYIPITESGEATDAGFIVFADSVGHLPDLSTLTRRRGVLAERPEGERPFLDGLEIDLNISAPQGSTVHLVIDPLLGDVINAVGSGRMELVRSEGEFSTFGTFDVSSGDYLFTAGEVFFRRFTIDSGMITWDGDPLDAMLNIAASYRTRASPDGLGIESVQEYIPLIIQMNVGGRVSTPMVDLSLALDRDDRNMLGSYASSIEAQLNQPEQVAQYATSVLLTNSFLLTTSAQSELSDTRNQLAFNSLSQLVASQLNRYLNYALPNVDLSLGVQGESTEDLDVTYGVALRLLDERLVIRGEGIYQSDQLQRTQQGVLDEFVVEVRLNPRVSVEVFYRREGDPLDVQSLNTSTTGAGVSYQTEFPTWRRLIDRLFGWLTPSEDESDDGEIAAGAGG